MAAAPARSWGGKWELRQRGGSGVIPSWSWREKKPGGEGVRSCRESGEGSWRESWNGLGWGELESHPGPPSLIPGCSKPALDTSSDPEGNQSCGSQPQLLWEFHSHPHGGRIPSHYLISEDPSAWRVLEQEQGEGTNPAWSSSSSSPLAPWLNPRRNHFSRLSCHRRLLQPRPTAVN